MDNQFWISIRTWSETWGLIKIFIMCVSFILFTESFKIKSELFLSSALPGSSYHLESQEPIASSVLLYILKGSVCMNLSRMVEGYLGSCGIILPNLSVVWSWVSFFIFLINTTTAIMYFTFTFPLYSYIPKACFSNLSHNLNSQYCYKEGKQLSYWKALVSLPVKWG